MGLIKFITVFDDDNQMILSESVLKRYNISAYPPVYFYNNKPYYDGLNTNSVEFIDLKKTKNVVGPQIPDKVFQTAFLQAYNDGYFAVVVVCPHSKWFPYYKQATSAANKLKRSRMLDFSTFRVCVIDSKSFAAGVLLHTLSMAQQYEVNHSPSDVVVDYGRKQAIKNKSFILLKSAYAFGEDCNEVSAFRSFGYKFEKIPISDSHDFVKFDLFSDIVCNQLKKGKGRYAVSLGADCDFAGSIIGRIEKKTGIMPICVIRYGVASSDIFGNSAICINILD